MRRDHRSPRKRRPGRCLAEPFCGWQALARFHALRKVVVKRHGIGGQQAVRDDDGRRPEACKLVAMYAGTCAPLAATAIIDREPGEAAGQSSDRRMCVLQLAPKLASVTTHRSGTWMQASSPPRERSSGLKLIARAALSGAVRKPFPGGELGSQN